MRIDRTIVWQTLTLVWMERRSVIARRHHRVRFDGWYLAGNIRQVFGATLPRQVKPLTRSTRFPSTVIFVRSGPVSEAADCSLVFAQETQRPNTEERWLEKNTMWQLPNWQNHRTRLSQLHSAASECNLKRPNPQVKPEVENPHSAENHKLTIFGAEAETEIWSNSVYEDCLHTDC